MRCREVMRLIERHKTTLVFCNTRGLAELIFQELWDGQRAGAADRHPPRQPVASRRGARSRRRWRRASCAALVAPPASTSASTGATSISSSRWARPRAARACCSGSAAPTTGSTSRARRSSSPATASNIWRRAPRWTRSTRASSIPKSSVRARSTCSPSTSWPWPVAGAVPARRSCSPKCASAAPYAGLKAETVRARSSASSPPAAMRSRPMTGSGGWSASPAACGASAKPSVAQQHRLNAGIIVEQPLLDVRFRNGRKLGTVEEGSPRPSRPAIIFFFAGLGLEVEQFKDTDIIVRASSKSARIVDLRRAAHVDVHPPRRTASATCCAIANDWPRFPDDVREWLEVQAERSVLPEPRPAAGRDLPPRRPHYMVAYSFEGWNAHQSLGMLITRRMEKRGPQAARLRRQRLCARLLRPRADHGPAVALLRRHPRAGIRRLGCRARTCSRPRSARSR